ncbi:putative het domain protein [Diaporthe ampelina]|uniref:Putative het domain protein n=1 Tax=Diaporthe ampelina TaxID=1214573 RepID=A0A0G2FML8_9PEZI|nr:putative het domain protein [Diaporthe ampelina]
MDHLPLPKNSPIDPIEVPYSCTADYDGGPMLEYPVRRGWKVKYSPWGIRYLDENGDKPSNAKLEDFIQTWLYFGFLHELFGDFADIKSFVTQNSHGKPVGEEAARSVSQLNMFLVDDMANKGWCPFDIDRVDKSATSATLLYYLAHLPPPRPDTDHSLCTTDVCKSMTIDPSYRTKHVPKDCQCTSEFSDTPNVINALQGDEIPLIQEVIQLEMLEWPAKEFDDPHTARFIEATDVEPKFRIIESGKGRNFVAISHVWAEGMGNPIGNSLPSCALKWISKTVDRFRFDSDESTDNGQRERTFKEASQGKTPFWLDTICVPVSPPEMWTKAMNRLRKPYQDAALVLVLDSYLYTQDTREIDALEMWARVLCCSWSRRLWTFQEGRLAKPGRLWVLFKDTVMSMEDIWRKFDQTLATEELMTELHLKWRGSNVIRGLAETGGNVPESILRNFRPEPTIWDMRESLKARAVSVPADEVLCLFCNMGLDMELVMRTPPKDRLAVFWRNIQVPAMLCDPKLLLWEESYETIFENEGTNFALRDEEGHWYFVETRDFWNQDRTDRPKAGERLAILHVQHIEDLDNSSRGALGQTTGDPFDFKLSIQAVLGTVEDPVSFEEGEDGEGKSDSDGDGHESETDDGEEAESPGETPDTYTLKETSRELCQKFADKFARFDPRTRNITLAVGANSGRDEEESYDHFAKSARFQLQMRRRNGMKRLKRETWWIID